MSEMNPFTTITKRKWFGFGTCEFTILFNGEPYEVKGPLSLFGTTSIPRLISLLNQVYFSGYSAGVIDETLGVVE